VEQFCEGFEGRRQKVEGRREEKGVREQVAEGAKA